MSFMERIITFWDQLSTIFLSFRIVDFLDICLVAFVLYNIIKLIRETRMRYIFKNICVRHRYSELGHKNTIAAK
jgi:DNA integrity scanning protein DisA with diadenylate cyclase activity